MTPIDYDVPPPPGLIERLNAEATARAQKRKASTGDEALDKPLSVLVQKLREEGII